MHILPSFWNQRAHSSAQTVSTQAFALAEGMTEEWAKAEGEDGVELMVKECINLLCELKGVGPATASAVMAAYKPTFFPFMADEGMKGAGGKLMPIKYTLPHYCLFAR